MFATPPPLLLPFTKQIVIFFAILASSTIGCVSAVYMAASQLVDANHRYRPDRINERTKSINGLIEWVFHKVLIRSASWMPILLQCARWDA